MKKDSSYIIYMHVNKKNNKKYIGQTCQDPERRWRGGEGYKDSPRFWAAIQSYGWDGFEHIILESNLNYQQANERECYWIQYYKTQEEQYGYNLTPGGNHYLGDKWQDPIFREKMHNSFSKRSKEIFSTQEGRDKVLTPMLHGIQRVWNNEEWRKNRIADITGDKNPNSKAVINIETGRLFTTIKAASEWAGLNSVSGIGQCCKGQRKTSGKHPITGEALHWRYATQKEVMLDES